MKIVLVDPSREDSKRILSILENCRRELALEFVECKGIQDFTEDLRKSCEVVLSEMDLNREDGLKLRDELFEVSRECWLIFVTNNEDKMSQAFGRNVVGYLKKSEIEETLPRLIQEVYHERCRKKLVNFKTPNGELWIRQEDILWVEQVGRHPVIGTRKDAIHLSSMPIAAVRHKLCRQSFIQISNHVIVNFDAIVSIKGKQVFLRDSDKVFEVSRTKINHVKERILKDNH